MWMMRLYLHVNKQSDDELSLNFSKSILLSVEISKNCCCDPNQTLYSVALDLGPYCLLRPVCPNTRGRHSMQMCS